MKETQGLGFEAMKEAQIELGNKVRAVLEEHGYKSVAADGYKSPGVIVSYTNDPAIKSGAKFSQAGMQIAGGVPLKCGEPEDFSTFRIGLFGLDKLTNIQEQWKPLQALSLLFKSKKISSSTTILIVHRLAQITSELPMIGISTRRAPNKISHIEIIFVIKMLVKRIIVIPNFNNCNPFISARVC